MYLNKKIGIGTVQFGMNYGISNISGQIVNTIIHNSATDGNAWWDLRSYNNQEIAPGLYIYVVEDTNPNNERNKFIGKFAIVR